MAKATHTGICQCCGSRQKLPNGILAKHGYTVVARGECGFFAGTCRGSDCLPLEVSCALVALFAEQARTHAVSLEGLAVEALALTGTTGWFHLYHPATWESRRSYYTWEKIDYLTYEFPRHQGVRGEAVESAAARGNKQYADHLRSEARKLVTYADQGDAIVAVWKPQELKAV